MDQIKNTGRYVLEASALAIALVLGAFWHKFSETLSYQNIMVLISVTIAAIIVFLMTAACAGWIYSHPSELFKGFQAALEERKCDEARFAKEIGTALNKFLFNQPFQSEETLAMIEANAHDIWVVSTDLMNDVNPGKIQESVMKNLEAGKSYTYFIPSSKNPHFPDAQRNEQTYKKWGYYKKYAGQIRFIHLPDHTLFLFREVVVYNPISNPNTPREVAEAMGFTYFDTTSGGSRDKLMKIPDDYLHFLIVQLHHYSDDVGLGTDIERLMKEFKVKLHDNDFLYLAKLIPYSRIEDKPEFNRFIERVRTRDENLGQILERTLGQYMDGL